MSSSLIELIRSTAPFALMSLSGLCIAFMFLNLRKGTDAHARPSFGHWPETAERTSPQTDRADTFARRLSLGLAVGIATGEALFLLFPRGIV
ncbi:MAG: hypothetical protein AAFY12_12260 [Pseudomonadota bacterium]